MKSPSISQLGVDNTVVVWGPGAKVIIVPSYIHPPFAHVLNSLSKFGAYLTWGCQGKGRLTGIWI